MTEYIDNFNVAVESRILLLFRPPLLRRNEMLWNRLRKRTDFKLPKVSPLP